MLLLLACFPAQLLAQKKERVHLDSLLQQLPAAKQDTTKTSLLLNLSNAYYRINKPDSSYFYLQLGQRLAQKLGWQHGIAKVYYYWGDYYYYYDREKRDNAKAENYFKRAVELSFKIGDFAYAYESMHELFWLMNDQKKLTEMISYLNTYAELFEKKGARSEHAKTIMQIADCYANMRNFSAAIGYYDQGFAMEKADHRSYFGPGRLVDVGSLYAELHYNKKAKPLLLKAAAECERAGYLRLLAYAYKFIAECADNEHQYAEAITYATKAAKVAERIGLMSVASSAENIIGWEYYSIREYEKAYSHTKRALALAKTDSASLAASSATLGIIYRDAPVAVLRKAGLTPGRQYEKAVALITGYINYTKINDPNSEGLFEMMRELSLTYEKMHRPEDALNAYKAYIIQKAQTDSLTNETAFALKEAQIDYSHKEDSLRYKQNITTTELKQKKQQSYFFMAGIGALLVLSVFIWLNYNNQRRSNRQISAEKYRSDELLLNILPADVAEELKEKGSSEARQFDEISVLFTDFVNFTRLSELLSPKELVNELNFCFKAFDEIMDTHHIEKIKTIGDAYLAAAGLPNADTNHAANAIKAAQEIQQFIHARKTKLGDQTFDIRIGIHSGSVVAGIVGVKKFAYDIWGDTVNTAARMEQNSEPGKINISESTYLLSKGQFKFTYRGEIEAKNKGALKMYFVESDLL